MRYAALLGVVLFTFGLCAVVCAEGAPAPLAMNVKALGGGRLNEFTDGVYGGTGTNNIGLLVKTWGRVTYVDSTNKFFYIDDGSGRVDGSSHLVAGVPVNNVGVRVSYDNLASGNSIDPPAETTYVAVTGIISTVMINAGGVDRVQPNLRPRRQTDIQ